MKILFYKTGIAAAMLATVLTSCQDAAQSKSELMSDMIVLTDAEIAADRFTPEVMWKMGRLSSPVISPDGERTVFCVTYYDVDENKGQTSLWTVPTAGGEPVRLTREGNAAEPQWSRDGSTIYFMSNTSGSMQIHAISPDGGPARQISDIEGGIEGFGISPDEQRAFYIVKLQVEKRESSSVFPDMPKSKALIYDDLMARHWDYWDRGDYSHIHVASIKGGKLEQGIDIMPGEPWDAPMAPYFDNHEIAWNNAGTQLAYTCKKLTGREYAVSTDSDIYLYDLASGTTKNLTQGMPGYDKYPVFSPDDNKIAFQSMERPGNEADKERLFVVDLASGEKSYLTGDFDYNAFNMVWESPNTILFLSPIEATHQLCRATLDGRIEVLTEGDHDINNFSYGNGKVTGSVTKISMASELYSIDPANGDMLKLTGINDKIYDNITFAEVQKRWVRTSDGKDMLVWVILPPDFDETKQYPALLYCQGGPQSVVSQSWSYRWNFQLMAAQGYVVVAPNRRGLPSFGQEWLDQISGDYSGQNIRDYLSAIDDVAKEPWVDNSRLGCVGASYGGYSAFFLAGNHNKRFKAFIAHCGIYNFESMYGSTEELFFVNNDYGGSYWSNNPVAQRSYANSPHKFIANWDSPILIITGLRDYRIPYTQSLEAFTAARMRGLQSRLVAFEDEAHQVFKPQNSLVWNREFFGWLDSYVKQQKGN